MSEAVPAKKKKSSLASGAGKKSPARTAPRGALRLLLYLALLLAVVAGGVLLCFGLYRFLFTANPQFTIEYIRIEATPGIDPRTVRALLSKLGIREQKTNLMTVNTATVRRRLEREDLIKQARVVRRFPDTLVVSLYERTPVAVLYCRPRRLIDAEGIVLPWWQTGDSTLLPRITGIRHPRKLKTGAKVTDESLCGALEFLKKIKTRPEGVLYDVSLIQLDDYLPSLKVHLRKRDVFCNDAVVVVPVKGMDAALDRLRDIVRIRSAKRQPIRFVDVTYERNVPVRS